MTSVSQPLAGSPSQSAKPSAHAEAGKAHRPAAHEGAPSTCGRAVQSLVHEPQWLTSFVETHAPPHAWSPPGHVHAPQAQLALHVWVAPVTSQRWVAPGAHVPSPAHGDQADHTPLAHDRVCIPHCPHACAMAPVHADPTGGGVGDWAGDVADDQPPQTGNPAGLASHAVVTAMVAPGLAVHTPGVRTMRPA